MDIYIPKTASAGEYQGNLAVRVGGETNLQIPVKLLVYDFELPDDPSGRTMLYFGYEDVNQRYLGEAYPDPDTPAAETAARIRDRHFMLAHRHRLSLIDSNDGIGDWIEDRPRPEWVPRLDGSLFTTKNGYDGPGVGTGNNVFSIGTYGSWSWQGEGQPAMHTHADAWVTWFEENSPQTEFFLYLIDESEDYAEIEQWAQWIESNPGPGRRLMSMATTPLPAAAQNTPSLDIPTTWATFGLTDVWQSAWQQFSNDASKRVWHYNGNRPATGSFATEDDGVALRALAWTQYKKGIDRWFFWEATYYNNYQGNTGQTDVFERALTFGDFDEVDSVLGETGWNYSNGDGVLMYPGTDTLYPQSSYGVEGPIASLRLKHWRRGVQDHQYLSMAAALEPARVNQIVEARIPKVLWEIGVEDVNDPTYVLTDISWSTDPDEWEAAREELAQIIAGAQAGPTPTATAQPTQPPQPSATPTSTPTPRACSDCQDDDRDGVPNCWDACDDTGSGRYVNSSGCPGSQVSSRPSFGVGLTLICLLGCCAARVSGPSRARQVPGEGRADLIGD